MYKKAFLCAVLVLAASAVSDEVNTRKKLHAKVRAHFETKYAKRAEDSCEIVKCGVYGDSCNDTSTYCTDPTECRDGICRTPIVGDECDLDSDCRADEDDDLYCEGFVDGVCKAYDKEGDSCTTTCKFKEGNPLVCDSTTKKCKVVKANPGEPCEYGTACQGGSVCRSVSYADKICYLYPDRVGATCNITTGCDPAKYIYCDSETLKCAELPGKGKECASYRCNKGLYCDFSENVCKEYKGVGEECSSFSECKDGLICADDGKCWSQNPKEGEHCDSWIECDSEHKCVDSVCVKKNGNCEKSDDCEGMFSYCDNGKCKYEMSAAEGEECKLSGYGDLAYLGGSMQCKEGLACVPNSRITTEGTCKKATAKKGKECKSDSDCPDDAFCSCNSKEGKMQCIPIPKSDKGLQKKANNAYHADITCQDTYDKKGAEEYSKCVANEVLGYYEAIQDLFDYSSSIRCIDFSSLLGAASSVKVSVVAMTAALLFALFF